MERRDDRDAQVAQKRQDKTARRTAIDAVFVLQADHVGVAEIQVVGGAPIGIEIVLAELKAHFRRVGVTLGKIVDRGDEAFRGGILLRHGLAQVVGEGRDAAFAREIVAKKGDLFDVGYISQE